MRIVVAYKWACDPQEAAVGADGSVDWSRAKPGISDYHNALKTGYDVEQLCWPDWVMALPYTHLLPQVFAPGEIIGHIQPDIATHFGIHPQCAIHAGTTDSIAAFIAADVNQLGIVVPSEVTPMPS